MPILRSMAAGVVSGLGLRCPACRTGRIFRTFFAPHRTCPSCGLVFEPGRGEFTGALMLAQGILMVSGGLSYVFLKAARVEPAWAIDVGLAVYFLVVPIFAYRHLKGAWIGILHGGHQG